MTKQKKTSSSSVGCNLYFELGPKEPGWDCYLNNMEKIQTENTIIIIIIIIIINLFKPFSHETPCAQQE